MSTTELASDFTVKTFDEMERIGMGMYVRARATLGVSAFGMQIMKLMPDSGDNYPEHDHKMDGQEEVYLLLDGSGHIALPDGRVDLARDKMIRVGPSTRRRLRSGGDGATVLVIGAYPGEAYTPPSGSELGAPMELGDPTASSAFFPDGPPPQLDC